jgi:hypothetical protein
MLYLQRGNEQSLPELKQYIGIYLEWLNRTRKLGYDVCFVLGNCPAPEFYMPTFRNTLSVPSS